MAKASRSEQSNPTPAISPNPKPLNILVIGDWVIDDNWVYGKHKSDTSTYVGSYHFRSLHHAGGTVKMACGAGRVAALLHAARWTIPFASQCNIHGLGLWHEVDTDYLEGMFNPENLRGSNPYRILGTNRTPSTNVRLYNLGAALSKSNLHYRSFNPDTSQSDVNSVNFGTTRIYRCYESTESGLNHISRVDWELPAPNIDQDEPSWIPSNAENFSIADIGMADETWSDIDLVVVKDNRKGVVSLPLISALLTKGRLKSIPWFVNAKVWFPKWVKYLHENNVDLRLQVYQEVALSRLENRVPTWISRRGRTTNEAAAEMLKVLSHNNKNPQYVVALPAGFSAIMLAQEEQQQTFYVQPKYNPHNILVENGVGKASAITAALTMGLFYQHAIEKKGLSTDYISNTLDGSLRFAHRWVEHFNDLLLNFHCATPHIEPKLQIVPPAERSSYHGGFQLFDSASNREEPLKEIGEVNSVSSEEFEKSSSQVITSILRSDKSGGDVSEIVLDLSLACIELNDYVCCSITKRQGIAKLIRNIRSFNPRHSRHATSGVILAKPGSGKSTLLRKLAETLDLHLLTYNITTLTRREDLLHCFDQIVTTQLNSPRDTRILVFIDEINAQIEGRPVYDAFLAPLEDGYYLRSGVKFNIKPCLWLFVGTADRQSLMEQSKGSDFISRMTMEELDLWNVPEDEGIYLRQENIFTGVTIAKKLYSGLQKIHKSIVMFLAKLDCHKITGRDIRHLMERNLRIDSLGRGQFKNPSETNEYWRDMINQHYATDSDNAIAKFLKDEDWIRIVT